MCHVTFLSHGHFARCAPGTLPKPPDRTDRAFSQGVARHRPELSSCTGGNRVFGCIVSQSRPAPLLSSPCSRTARTMLCSGTDRFPSCATSPRIGIQLVPLACAPFFCGGGALATWWSVRRAIWANGLEGCCGGKRVESTSKATITAADVVQGLSLTCQCAMLKGTWRAEKEKVGNTCMVRLQQKTERTSRHGNEPQLSRLGTVGPLFSRASVSETLLKSFPEVTPSSTFLLHLGRLQGRGSSLLLLIKCSHYACLTILLRPGLSSKTDLDGPPPRVTFGRSHASSAAPDCGH